MDESITTPRERARLRWYLKRILFVLQLPVRMAHSTSDTLEKQRDDCGRAAYSIAFWVVEEFSRFNLTVPPSPSAQQPGYSEAQLKAWVLGILRRLDDTDDQKPVLDNIPTDYGKAIEQYHLESEAARKMNKRLKIETFCSKHNLNAQVFRGYREQVRGRKRRGQS